MTERRAQCDWCGTVLVPLLYIRWAQCRIWTQHRSKASSLLSMATAKPARFSISQATHIALALLALSCSLSSLVSGLSFQPPLPHMLMTMEHTNNFIFYFFFLNDSQKCVFFTFSFLSVLHPAFVFLQLAKQSMISGYFLYCF